MEQTPNINDINRVAPGTFIKGELKSSGDIRIDGEIEGDIESKSRVVVGEKALIKGNVSAANADVWGRVEGDISVSETLALKSGCSVKGTLSVKRLSVELGADFQGTCKTVSD